MELQVCMEFMSSLTNSVYLSEILPLCTKQLTTSWCLFFRLRIQHEGLIKEEQEQNEFIEQFILQK